MVRELERVNQGEFPETAPTANPVFYRTYSRKTENGRETWIEVCDRTINGLRKLGQLTPEETDLLYRMQSQLKAMSSGRWLWVGGTEWITQPQNFSGAYNCSSTNIMDWRAFGLLMDLAMMGCGTGAVLEGDYINQLPPIRNHLNLILRGEIGSTPAELRREFTELKFDGDQVEIYVGDSRQGWVGSYQALLELSTDERFSGEVKVIIDLSDVRPAGEPLKGFGGVANPVKLPELYQRCGNILNQAVGRQLNSVECCLLIDEAAVTIVAGNIRRCLPEGALVHTASGLVPIEKIRIGDRVLTSKGFYPVTNFFDQGTQSLCRIQTEDGYFECTADHKVAVLQDLYGNYKMIKAQDLQEGDRLIFVPQAIPGTPTELPELKGVTSHGAKPITVPALTSEVAYFLGYLHGDGSVPSDGWRVRFRVHQDSPEILERLINVAQEFGLETHTLRTPEQCKTKAYELQLNSSILNKYLSQFKQSFTSITIPDCILMGTKEIRQAYLAGLADADGCHYQGVLVASVYQDFLRQVQALYASLGITTRLCGSVRKRTGKWEGELVTVGESAFEAVEKVMMTYSTQFPVKKRKRPKFFHDHGFPSEMAQPLVNTFDWNKRKQMMVRIVKNFIADATDLIPVKVKKVEMDVREASTYDIEVASIHEFVCEGVLVANSAGMRQGNSSDRLFALAKDNLWRQDENGNWGIDPERDALRMANHTHVFHHKPTLEECVEAVRKQFYSGEGAIQWAGEAVARANRDLVSTPEIKRDFLKAYGQDNAKKWFQEHYPNISNDELEHRLARLGLNPCVTADTWIHTEFGARQVKELIGVQHGTFVNGELFSTTPDGFFETGTKPILKLETKEGFSIRLTENHLVLKIISQTQKKQYTKWVPAISLKPGDKVCLHNHREIQKWDGEGTFEEGWLLGSMVGDGSIAKTQSGNDIGILRYWGKSQNEMLEYAIAALDNSALGHPNIKGCHHNLHNMSQVSSSKLAVLGDQFGINRKHKVITSEIERGSYNFYCGFLRGIFDADGSVQGDQNKGVSIRLAQSNLNSLLIIQRMLARIGIISTVYQNRRSENVRKLPDSNRNLAFYHCKANHELVISKDNLPIFQELIGFKEPAKNEKLAVVLKGYKRTLNRDRFTATVKSITPDGTETVYDCTVPGPSRFDANGFVVHNCGEIIGSNFHCVSGDTLLITRDSIHKIKDIVGQKVEIWNGKNWSQVIPIKTGKDRKLYRVKFGDGSYLDVTEYHRFFVKDRFGKNYEEVQTKDLLTHSKYVLHTEPFVIDYQDGNSINLSYAYTLGVAVGKSVISYQLSVISKSYLSRRVEILELDSFYPLEKGDLKADCLVTDLGFSEELIHRLQTEPDALNTIASWNKPAILAFIAGLADTDGSNTKGHGIRIYLSDYERAKRLQLLLTKCGIRAMVSCGSTTNLGERNKDLYYLQITDCSEIPCKLMTGQDAQSTDLKQNNQTIQSVEELPGLHDTYCFEEPEFHKGVFGNTLTGNCNLSEIHLNQIDPNNHKDQEEAFTAAALSVATLLNHKFVEPRYRYSRELDPIVGVSFTGLFDFFVKAFGIEWLRWWQAGRPATIQGLEFKQQEAEYLTRWREIVHQVVWDYCDRHNLKRPNRCTTVQPSGTKSLLTNAAPGWHPPFGLRWVRRITFAKNDPVALACLDYGYSVIPGQSSKDENGNLLNDPFDDRAKEWLVEIPVQVSWIDLPGVEEISIEKFSATAMFDFYMGVQQHWTTHNTSSTILLTEAEIEPLGKRIYEAIRDDEGYISSALLARFDAPFPRLPFERISQEEYEKMQEDVLRRRKSDNFSELMNGYVLASELPEMGPQDPACSGMVCELKGSEP